MSSGCPHASCNMERTKPKYTPSKKVRACHPRVRQTHVSRAARPVAAGVWLAERPFHSVLVTLVLHPKVCFFSMWKLKCKFRKTLQLVTRPPPFPSKDLSLVVVDLVNIRSIHACCALEPAIEARSQAFRCSSGPKLKLYGPRRRPAISPADRTGASSRAHKPPVDHLYRYRQLSHLAAATWDISPAPYFIETETLG